MERAKSGIDDRHFLYRDDVISGTVSISFGEVGFHLSWGDWAACSGSELVSDIMGWLLGLMSLDNAVKRANCWRPGVPASHRIKPAPHKTSMSRAKNTRLTHVTAAITYERV